MFDDGPDLPPPGPPVWLAGLIVAWTAMVITAVAVPVWLIVR